MNHVLGVILMLAITIALIASLFVCITTMTDGKLRDVSMFFSINFEKEAVLEQLDLRVLDGIANDDFSVYVDNQLVYSYTSDTATNEYWVIHNIDLKKFNIVDKTVNEIKVEATGQKWGGFNTWGQLGVDYITLDGVTVDIGNTTSEANFTLSGWGIIHPDTIGGNWGGFRQTGENCRTTWFKNDNPEATVLI